MKELLLYIARSLVDHPDQVTVTEVENGDELTLELPGPHRQGEPHGRALLCPAHRRQGIRGYRGLIVRYPCNG